MAGLEPYGTDQHFIDIVKNLYEGASTVFKTEKGHTEDIPMRKGVKQGDLLSPLLFNIAMDPMLAAITSQKNG